MLKRWTALLCLGLLVFSTASGQNKALKLVLVTNADTANYSFSDEKAEAAFESALRQKLIEGGHTVLDASQLASNQERTLVTRIFQGDVQTALTLANTLKIDAIVASRVGSSEIAQQQVAFVRAYAYRAFGDVRVILASNAQIIATATPNATGTGTSQGDAQFNAFKVAGESSGGSVTPQLKKLAENPQAVSIDLTVTGIKSFGDANLLIAELGKQSNVKSAERRSFSSGVLTIDIQFLGKVDDFAATLENLSLVKLEVTAVNGFTVEAKVK
jgi:hypothetical protein